jgi:hypothetical protein
MQKITRNSASISHNNTKQQKLYHYSSIECRALDKKQKEALIIALAEKGETYSDITKKPESHQIRLRQF